MEDKGYLAGCEFNSERLKRYLRTHCQSILASLMVTVNSNINFDKIHLALNLFNQQHKAPHHVQSVTSIEKLFKLRKQTTPYQLLPIPLLTS